MNRIRLTYFALGAFVFAASCTNGAVEPDVYEWAKGEIYFKPSLADVVSSRAEDMTIEHLESFQVTCFNTVDKNTDASGIILPYFEDATFIRQSNHGLSTFVSSPDEGPYDWPQKDGLLKFFAFAPSRAVMAAGNSALVDADRSNYFNLRNSTTDDNSSVAIDYRLGIVRVNPDIAGQFDFVTAETSGERWKDFTGGIDIAFCHQFSQVELRAWGSNAGYDFEIAGVRLGNPVVEGSFVFSDSASPSRSAGWEYTENPVKDKVEYLYKDSGDVPGSGDKVFCINRGEHNTLESAESIMGCGGCAMVLPTTNSKWAALADPNIGVRPYSTREMYFSVLLRVTNSSTGSLLYPYPGNPYNMTVIYYALDQSGSIVARLYPGLTEGEFFTDREMRQPYMAAEGEKVREFGWAAVPVDADWSSGKRYVYTLNYSEGIGLHDPQDPDPGKPIVFRSPVSWGVTVDTWHDAEKSEDYDPDVNVP